MIYLASPYSSPSHQIRVQRYNQVMEKASQMVKEGRIVYSPIIHFHEMAERHNLPTDYAFWKYLCEQMLFKADSLALYKMPGWEESVGMSGEIELARKINLPIEEIIYVPRS